MQLGIISLVFCLLIFVQTAKAQISRFVPFKKGKAKAESIEMDSTVYDAAPPKPIELDILASYYAQDGNNAAVTGGIGTELLSDYTSKIILKVPVNQKLQLNLDAGFDYYSSASTDNINNIVSSASSSDVRAHANVGFQYQLSEQNSFGARLGASGEYDYTSLSTGLDYGWMSKDKNTSVGLSMQTFIDRWSFFLPSELRRDANQLATDKRQSYNASLTLSQIINKKMQVSLQVEGVMMNGLLSTPFHRVYFTEQSLAKLERLPDKRTKIPIGLRMNYHVSEHLIARLYYRYYWDSWGMQAHTASVELPVKLNRFLSVYPFYRFHQQSAIDYFKPYKEHQLTDEFYTSDFDLSDLTSQTFGLGVSYSPVNGLARMKLPFKKRPVLMLKSLDLKYSHYRRSTGLNANIVSLGISFSF